MTDYKYYQEELLEHYKYPRYRGLIKNPDFTYDELNPSCGDKICMTGKIGGNIITELAFEGNGCVISQAAAEMIASYSHGKNINDVLLYTQATMQELIKIPLGPVRMKCALLGLQVLQMAIKSISKNS